MAGKRVVIDGVLVDLPDGIVRVSDLRHEQKVDPSSQLVQVKGSSSKVLNEDDEIEDNAQVRSIPSITKG
jgi:hypothetical protein